MANDNYHKALPPTVRQVVEEFVTRMRADPDIPDDVIDRLETHLLKGEVPKVDDIKVVLFGPSAHGEP